MHNSSISKRSAELLERCADLSNARENFRAGKHGNIVFSKIDPGFHHRNQIHQLFFDRLQALGKRALKLLCRDLGLIKRLRLDQVTYGFSLREINAAIEKGAHGELAGLRQARAASRGRSKERRV